jgi:hypothetical protein
MTEVWATSLGLMKSQAVDSLGIKLSWYLILVKGTVPES